MPTYLGRSRADHFFLALLGLPYKVDIGITNLADC